MTTTITDDDAAPIRHHSQRQPVNSLGEDDSATSVTVTATLERRQHAVLPTTVVTIGTLAGSATKDTDYTVDDAREHHHPGKI